MFDAVATVGGQDGGLGLEVGEGVDGVGGRGGAVADAVQDGGRH